MRKNNSFKMIITAIIAALYVVLGLIFSAISFGPVQVRVSAMLYQLVAYNKKYFWGLVLGTIILNLFSPLGMYDMVFGVATSAVGMGVAIIINHFVKSINAHKVIVGLCVSASTVFVAWELVLVAHVPFLMTWGTVALGQLLSQLAGIPAMTAVNKRLNLKEFI